MRLSFFSNIMRHRLSLIILPLLLLTGLNSCLSLSKNAGTPDDLMVRQRPKNSVVIDHQHYSLSFNTERLVPNWVSWQLTREEASTITVKRRNKFLPDPMVGKEYRVEDSDYSGELKHTSIHLSRGHMAPFADMRFDSTAADECFLLTNICPQSATLNAGDWGTLETICREKWAMKDSCIYIVCGPIFRAKEVETIGKRHKVAVPDAFFKVVLSLKKGEEKAIGFIFENNNDRQPYDKAVHSVNDIERITGFDFFDWLPNHMERRLEKQADISQWER